MFDNNFRTLNCECRGGHISSRCTIFQQFPSASEITAVQGSGSGTGTETGIGIMQESLSTPKENDLGPSTEAANSDVVVQQQASSTSPSPSVQPKMNMRRFILEYTEGHIVLINSLFVCFVLVKRKRLQKQLLQWIEYDASAIWARWTCQFISP